MSLSDDLQDIPVVRTGYRPRADIWLESLNDEDRAAMHDALMNPAWPTLRLVRVAHKHGLRLSDSTFGKWRRAYVESHG